jgi:hypothetical protein
MKIDSLTPYSAFSALINFNNKFNVMADINKVIADIEIDIESSKDRYYYNCSLLVSKKMPLSLPINIVKRISSRYDLSLDEILVSSDNVQHILKIIEKVEKESLDFYNMLDFPCYLSRIENTKEILNLLSKVEYVDESEEDTLVVMNMVFKQLHTLGINRYITNGVYKFRFTLMENYIKTNNIIYDNDMNDVAWAYPDEYYPEYSFVRINSSDLGETLRACAYLCRGKRVDITSFIDEIL